MHKTYTNSSQTSPSTKGEQQTRGPTPNQEATCCCYLLGKLVSSNGVSLEISTTLHGKSQEELANTKLPPCFLGGLFVLLCFALELIVLLGFLFV